MELAEAKKLAKGYGLSVKTVKNSFGHSATIYDLSSANSTNHNVYLATPETRDFLARLREFRENFREVVVMKDGIKVIGLKL